MQKISLPGPVSMFKKTLFRLVLVGLFLWLAGCAPAVQATPLSATATFTYATPDGSLSTPTVGFGTVLEQQGAQGVLLRSRPNPNSPVAGTALAGDSGKILGVDATGTWALVHIKNQTGWIMIQLLAYNIAK